VLVNHDLKRRLVFGNYFPLHRESKILEAHVISIVIWLHYWVG